MPMKIPRSLLIFSVALALAGTLLAPGAPAQTAGPALTLSPSSGQAPSASGSLAGSGWCYPIRGLAVSGSGVAGSASVDAAGTLSGSFTVRGSAGDTIVVTVGGTCSSGPVSASATFTFASAAAAATVTSTAAPTNTATPRPTETRPPPRTATSTPAPTPPATPAASQPLVAAPTAAPRALSPATRGALRLLGCANSGGQVWLELVPATLAGTPRGGPVRVPAVVSDQTEVFSFEIPPMQTGQSFLVSARSEDPACPLADQAPATWVAGGGRPLALAITPSRKTFLGAWRPGPPTEGGDARTGLRAGTLQPLLPLPAPGQGDWAAEVELAGPLNQPYLFQWSTGHPGADAGIWQVSTQPFPQGARDDLLSPPGLVASASVDCVNCTFSVDLSALASAAGAARPPGRRARTKALGRGAPPRGRASPTGRPRRCGSGASSPKRMRGRGLAPSLWGSPCRPPRRRTSRGSCRWAAARRSPLPRRR